jgi:hypothetical protein
MKPTAQLEQSGNWYVLVAVLHPPENPIVLAPGISVRPLPHVLTVFDLAAAGTAGFKAWAALEPFCNYCAVEIETAKDADVTPGYDALNRAWLAAALLVLRGFTALRSIAYSAYSWQRIAGCQRRFASTGRPQKLPPFRGGLLDLHLTSIPDKHLRLEPITDLDIVWIQKHFETFNRLASESEKFRFALEASNDWRFAKEPRSAVARLWSGIEALFEINSELVYRISLLSAALLTSRGPARKEKFDAIRKLYGFRSKVVHGETLPEEKILEVVSDSFQLLRDLLLVSIEKGHPLNQRDFDDAVFC